MAYEIKGYDFYKTAIDDDYLDYEDCDEDIEYDDGLDYEDIEREVI